MVARAIRDVALHGTRPFGVLARTLTLPPAAYIAAIVVLHAVLVATTVAAVGTLLTANLHYAVVTATGLALVLSYLLCAVALVRTRRHRLAETSTSIALTALAIGFCLSTLEAVFAAVPRSHGVGYTLAARLWFKTYWKPINSLGYRDREHDLATLGDKRTIVIVGDSFVAGHGLTSIDHRFSEVLQERLASGHVVMNIGVNGIDTREEYRRLRALPIEPDIVVLSYFGNDIVEAAEAAGRSMPRIASLTSEMPVVPRVLLERSYLLNYMFWLFPHADMAQYFGHIESSYHDPRSLEIHRADLLRFVAHCRARDIAMVVVLFPYLQDLEGSLVYTDFIEGIFTSEGVPVLRVSDLVRSMPPDQRVVNSNDVHASRSVHRMIGDALFERLKDDAIGRVSVQTAIDDATEHDSPKR